MPNLRGKEWTTTTPANVEDAQYWEDHLISDEDAAKIGTVILPPGGTVGQVLTKKSSSPNDADWDDPASSGHTIQDEDGTDMPYQQTLQFVNAEVSNDSANDRTVVDCKGAKGDAATITVGTVSTLPAGSSATVVNSGTTSDAVFDFGIPRGADGTDGTDGEDGFSPAVTITSIPGGHQVNITDAEHPQGQTFNVMDGDGTGDMQASAYDPNNDVYNAGGIPAYLADEIVANPTGTPTDDLTSIQIGSTIYRLKGGGMEIIQIPSVVGDSFTYNGIAQGPTITGLDSTHCTVTGETAVNAGTYTMTIALNDPSSMVWSDLTTADKTYSYTIAKANQTLTLSKNSVTLDANTLTDTVTVSGASTSLSATSSDDTVASASVSGSTVTISNVNQKTGTATISISAAADANHNASAAVSVSVTATFSITKTITVSSAASDTLTFTDESGSKTVTTDSSGVGSTSVTILPSGSSITFTSSVAKNPDNLSQAYSKAITITVATTSVYVMPDNTIFWYGYESSNFAIANASNGWSSSGYSYENPTKQTYYYLCNSTSATNLSYITNKNSVNASVFHVLARKDSGFDSASFLLITRTKNAVESGRIEYKLNDITTSVAHYTLQNTLTNPVYLLYGAEGRRAGDGYALWYE